MEAVKLTLRLDKQVIERGKVYAKEQGTSLSKLFEAFLRDRIKKQNLETVQFPYKIDEDILAMRIIQNGEPGSYADTDYYSEYADHVANKHLKEE